MRNEKISVVNFGFCFISQIDPQGLYNILISQLGSLQLDSWWTFSQISKNEQISVSLEGILWMLTGAGYIFLYLFLIYLNRARKKISTLNVYIFINSFITYNIQSFLFTINNSCWSFPSHTRQTIRPYIFCTKNNDKKTNIMTLNLNG